MLVCTRIYEMGHVPGEWISLVPEKPLCTPRTREARSNSIQPDYLKKSALIFIYCLHSSGTADSSKIAVTGQAGSHAPQSIHSSGLMKRCSASSYPSSLEEG